MGNWLFTLNIVEAQKQAKEGLITPKAWANKVANEIKNQLGKILDVDTELDQIVFDLEYNLGEDVSWDDTDEILEVLYDWADYNRCWVKSF